MKRILASSLFLCALGVLLSSVSLYAADDPWQKPVTLELNNVELPRALSQLFADSEITCSVGSDFKGVNVPALSLKGVTLRDALGALCEAADVEYKIEANGGHVVVRGKPGSHLNPLGKIVSIDMKDARLGDAVEHLFKGSNIDYVVDPDAADIIVPKIVFTDAALGLVLRDLTKLTGTTYSLEDGVVRITKPGEKGPLLRIVNVEIKDKPISEAVDMLLKDTGLMYMVDPTIAPLKVTAVMRNVTLRKALDEITRAAGAEYTVGKYGNANLVHIDPRGKPAGQPSGFRQPAPRESVDPNAPVERVNLSFVEPADVVYMLRTAGGVQVVSSGPSYVVLKGDQQSLERAKNMIRLIDTPDAFPKAIRVKLIAKATLQKAGAKPQVWSSGTQSVGMEGVPMPLNVTGSKQVAFQVEYETAKGKSKVTQFSHIGANLVSTITPSIVPADPTPAHTALPSNVSLNGQGQISGDLGPGKGPADTTHFEKKFDVAVSAAPGQPVCIASGSFDIGGDSVSFEVTATAWIEKARLVRPQLQQGGGGGGGGFTTGVQDLGGGRYKFDVGYGGGGGGGYGGNQGGGGGGGRGGTALPGSPVDAPSPATAPQPEAPPSGGGGS